MLFTTTVLLASISKMLLELDKLFSNDFWLAVLGGTPIEDLGPNGLIMLVVYIAGAVLWWMVTALLLKVSQIWLQRFGLA